jgi:hypothetical protein
MPKPLGANTVGWVRGEAGDKCSWKGEGGKNYQTLSDYVQMCTSTGSMKSLFVPLNISTSGLFFNLFFIHYAFCTTAIAVPLNFNIPDDGRVD